MITAVPQASKYVVAAICGCWNRESGVNPGIWESLTPTDWNHVYAFDGIGGYGLGQWTNIDSETGRLWQLHTYVTENGYGDGSGIGELNFMLYEDYWHRSAQTIGSYSTLEEFLQTTETNLETLVRDFMANWEGAPDNNIPDRLEAAQKFLDYINLNMNKDPKQFTWTSENAYITEEQTLANVMSIFFWFKYQGEPGKYKKKKMPLWLMLWWG